MDPTLEPVATGVWLLRGGVPRAMNAYLLEDDGGGVTLFDTGIRAMAPALIEAAGTLGRINRGLLSHRRRARGRARSGGSTGWCSAPRASTIAGGRRGSGCRCGSTPPTRPTPRATP